MDVETFLGEVQGSVTNLMTKELQDFDSAKVQTPIGFNFRERLRMEMGTSLELIQLIRHSIVG